MINKHTDEDMSILTAYMAARAERKYKSILDKACANGNHGFNLKTQCVSGGIYTYSLY